MYIAILGRQPALGMAELEKLYGGHATAWFSDHSATIQTNSLSITTLGGTQKAGIIITELPRGTWREVSAYIVRHFSQEWQRKDHKITLGISAYNLPVAPRDIQKTGIVLKQLLKKSGVSLRLIPNAESALNTAVSHHNKLGLSDNKVELLIVRSQNGRIAIATSVGAQSITALARRDQGRPKRDAFVGMLPPKLALMMVNLATPASMIMPDTQQTLAPTKNPSPRLLDPFCGTGVVLQEAALRGYTPYGTDLAEKMIDYSRENLEWLAQTHHLAVAPTLSQADATSATWQSPIDAVACEAYLGQPFSAPPSAEKQAQVVRNCNHIISSFLQNIAPQIASGTPLCVAVPAWRNQHGEITHLPLVRSVATLGYLPVAFRHTRPEQLIYYRENQVVARELLTLIKA